ncbi:MAG: response regulator [Bacillus sp. (in: Bacteria)]|nr:response regulator [Bacillus sp. (in: firmicutes)]
MEKYQKIFFDRLVSTLSDWKKADFITNEDLYQFLHTIKGTAGSIGLEQLSATSEKLMDVLKNIDEKQWQYNDWLLFLGPMMEHFAPTQIINLGEEGLNHLSSDGSRNKTVLIYREEDFPYVNGVKRLLKTSGYKVLVENNILKAVHTFYEYQPDCIMIDINHQEKGGASLETFDPLFETAKMGLVPIIVTFPTKNTALAVAAYEAGVTDVIHEPVMEELYALIKNRVKLKHQLDTLVMKKGKEAVENQIDVFHEEIDPDPVYNNEKLIRIGVIDDDPVIQQLLVDYLRQMKLDNLQIEVKGFREGESFLASDWHQQRGRYILLIDGMMPRMDGLEVVQEIRNLYREEDFIIIMLTARKRDKDVVAALNIGADDYLTKPFSLMELDARIKRYAARFQFGR